MVKPTDEKVRIMVVEDDPLLRQLYINILTERSYQITGVATNGEEAIKVYNDLKIKPNLILLDYKLPLLNGLEVTKRLQKIDSKINVFMITGDSTLDSDIISSHGIILRRKPIKLDEILDVINKIDRN